MCLQLDRDRCDHPFLSTLREIAGLLQSEAQSLRRGVRFSDIAAPHRALLLALLNWPARPK